MADPADRLCPECGQPANARWPVAVSLWPKRRMIPAALVLLAAVALVVFGWRTHDTFVTSSGTPLPALVSGASHDALTGIAAGQDADQNLREALLAATDFPLHQPGATAIEVNWAAPPNTVTTYMTWGWPVPWRTRLEGRWYEDPVARAGFVPGRTDTTARPPRSPTEGVQNVRQVPPRNRFTWSGARLFHQPAPEATGGAAVTESYDLFPVLWPVGAGVIIWSAGSTGLLLARLIRGRREPRRARQLVTGAAVIAAILALGLLIFPSDRDYLGHVPARPTQVGTPPAQVYWKLTGYNRLPISRQELASNPPSDQQLAQLLLDAAGPPPQPGQLLAAAAVPEAILARASSDTYSPKLRLLEITSCQYERRGDFGDVEPLPMPFQLRVTGHTPMLSVQWGSGASRTDVTRISVTVTIALGAILGLWLVWLLARLGATASLAITARRRRRRGQCVACGYG